MGISEFSKLAGVSTATVSRAFSGKGRISPDTRDYVLKVAQKHGFAPNIHAQRMQAKQSGVIGLLYSFSAKSNFDYFHMELATQLAGAASRSGYATQLELTDEPEIKNQHTYSLVNGKGVDGLILVADSGDSALEFLRHAPNFACVVISTKPWPKCPATGLVQIDFRSGIGQALDSLISDGHRRIGFMRGMLEETKESAYIEIMRERGLSVRPSWISNGSETYEGGAEAMQDLLKTNVSAVLCANDILALGAMHAAIEQGFCIPKDLSIIGIDNVAFARFTTPSLSSIGIAHQGIAEAAMEMVIKAIRGDANGGTTPKKRRPYVEKISTVFVPRNSSGKYQGRR